MSNPAAATMSFVQTLHHDSYPFIDPLKADLSKKTVMITGAAKGLGKAIALSYARAGASKIALGARSGLDALVTDILAAASSAGRPAPQILPLTMDVSSEASVQAAADRVAAEFGSVDVLINNAGYSEVWVPVGESDPSEWKKSWDVNMNGTYLTTRFFLPLVLKSETKTIMSLSSVGAHQIFPGASAYQTIKFALSRFHEFLNAEYGAQGLVAFVVHPGGVKTEMAERLPEALLSWLVDTPELAGDSLAWLGGKKRDYLGGRFVVCNWDMEELEAKESELVGTDKLRFRMVV